MILEMDKGETIFITSGVKSGVQQAFRGKL